MKSQPRRRPPGPRCYMHPELCAHKREHSSRPQALEPAGGGDLDAAEVVEGLDLAGEADGLAGDDGGLAEHAGALRWRGKGQGRAGVGEASS